MIKALLTTACILTTCLGAEAAYVTKGGAVVYEVSDVPVTHQRLFRTLSRVGVPVVNGSTWRQCKPGKDSYIAGFYAPRHNVIVLCPNSPAPDLLGTLVHEAVHAVQDCRAGQDNSAMRHATTRYMIDGISTPEHQTIRNLYPTDQHLDEIEARYLDQYPDYVADQLDTYCL